MSFSNKRTESSCVKRRYNLANPDDEVALVSMTAFDIAVVR